MRHLRVCPEVEERDVECLSRSHTIRHRVGYAETDQMGVAHHSCHLVWFERARIEYLRANGVDYRELEESGVVLPVREAVIRYHRPARFDEELVIEAELVEMGKTRCRFHYAVRRINDDAPIADGGITLAFCNRAGRPIRNGPERLKAQAGK